MASLEQDLCALGLELRETHISRVFLSEDAVYKVRKPVALGFLDFSTLAARRRDCEAEVALNRRLAPDVYQGVVAITLDSSGVHRLGGLGEPVEWAVQMRRLPDADAADARLRQGRFGRVEVGAIAERLVRFHAAARCDAQTASFGSVEAITANVRENFEQTRESAARVLDARELAALERWQLDFLARERARLQARVAHGCSRDGHGDLRLEHCYLDAQGGIEIIDCIEFNDRFRYGDVAADLAFLAMDLSWHERSDLSEALLAEYAQRSGDYDLYGVIDFYQSYRAYVRGKVCSFLEADPGVSLEARTRAAADARKYYLLAEASSREPLRKPALYAVGGLIACGKSTLAAELGSLLDAPVIDADRARKQLASVAPETPWHDAAFSGHYDAGATAEVYAELLRRARVVLESKRPVVLDASFRSAEQRLAAQQLAQGCGVPFTFIECVADPALCRTRLLERARGASISDGRLEIFDEFAASYQPVRELPPGTHLRIDTGQSQERSLVQLRAHLS